jgi:AraC family transcriptional regulator
MRACRSGPKAVARGLAAWQLNLALQLLLGDLAGDNSLTWLACQCGLSRSHFSKAFKISMGQPPHRWLMRRRIARARSMLARSDESIAEIAISCGFADQSHLTRVFHSVVGSSPAAWRRPRRVAAARAAAAADPRKGRQPAGMGSGI